MSRLPRLYLLGCAQHVIQRGNNRAACFCGEEDYKTYLSFLKDAADKYQVAVHAFVLMTNHGVSLYRIEPGAGREGGARLGLSLVQLPRQCTR